MIQTEVTHTKHALPLVSTYISCDVNKCCKRVAVGVFKTAPIFYISKKRSLLRNQFELEMPIGWRNYHSDKEVKHICPECIEMSIDIVLSDGHREYNTEIKKLTNKAS